jgi:hypothetical protein
MVNSWRSVSALVIVALLALLCLARKAEAKERLGEAAAMHVKGAVTVACFTNDMKACPNAEYVICASWSHEGVWNCLAKRGNLVAYCRSVGLGEGGWTACEKVYEPLVACTIVTVYDYVPGCPSSACSGSGSVSEEDVNWAAYARKVEGAAPCQGR